MKKFVLALLVCCCLSGVTGCVTKLADVTVISTKNIDLQNSLHTVDRQRWVTGIDREYMILLFPTGKVDMEEALNDAQDKAGCVALANATITSCFWYIPYIYGQMRYEVTGNPVYESSTAVPTSKVNPEPPSIPEEQRQMKSPVQTEAPEQPVIEKKKVRKGNTVAPQVIPVTGGKVKYTIY